MHGLLACLSSAGGSLMTRPKQRGSGARHSHVAAAVRGVQHCRVMYQCGPARWRSEASLHAFDNLDTKP